MPAQQHGCCDKAGLFGSGSAGLGIFGRENVFAASLWRMSDNLDYLYAAFSMFRNYDNQGGSFGNTSISAVSNDWEKTSIYASTDSDNPNKITLVAINKTDEWLDAELSINHGVPLNTTRAYILTSESTQSQEADSLTSTGTNSFIYSMPPLSVSTIVLEP